MKNSWMKYSLLSLFLLAIICFSACKKEIKEDVSICTSNFEGVVDLDIKYHVSHFSKRSFVYRSNDNVTFNVVGEVPVQTMSENEFIFSDTTLRNDGTYFYKVGYGSILSQVQSVYVDKTAFGFQVFPNPVKDTLFVSTSNTCFTYSFTLFNQFGMVVKTLSLQSGDIFMLVNGLSNGIYVYEIQFGIHSKKGRIIINR